LLFSNWFGRKKYRSVPEPINQPPSNSISASLAQNITFLHSQFSQTPDLVVRHFVIKQSGDQAALVYLCGLIDKNAKSVNLTLTIPGHKKSGPIHTDHVSIMIQSMKTKVKTSYQQNKFRFDIYITMPVDLTELLFPFDVRKNGKELEKMISEQVQKKFENLIKKIQENQIDPIGLGLNARAHEYRQYKKVEDHWGETLSRANIHISVKVIIRSRGPLK
jgi:hypothetical protein